MSDLITKAILSGVGLASLTTEAVRKTIEDLVNQSKLSEQEGRRVVAQFQRRSRQAQKKLEKQVNAAVHKVFNQMDLTTLQSRLKGAKSTRKKKTAQRASTATTR